MPVCCDCVCPQALKYVPKCIRSFGGILAAVDQCHHAFPSGRVLSTSHIFPHRPCFFWLSLHRAVSPLQSICLITQVPEIETASAASLCVDTGPGVHPSIHPSNNGLIRSGWSGSMASDQFPWRPRPTWPRVPWQSRQGSFSLLPNPVFSPDHTGPPA